MISWLVVANSNRFEAVDSKGDTKVAILDVRNPAAVTVLKTIQPTPPNSLNSFPRDITLGPALRCTCRTTAQISWR
jgi:hypothetical protein